MTRRRSVGESVPGIDAGLVHGVLVADEAPHVPQGDLSQQVGGLGGQDPLPADPRDEAHRRRERHHVHVGLEVLDDEDRLGAGLDRPPDLLQQARDDEEHAHALGARPRAEPTNGRRAPDTGDVPHHLDDDGVQRRPQRVEVLLGALDHLRSGGEASLHLALGIGRRPLEQVGRAPEHLVDERLDLGRPRPGSVPGPGRPPEREHRIHAPQPGQELRLRPARAGGADERPASVARLQGETARRRPDRREERVDRRMDGLGPLAGLTLLEAQRDPNGRPALEARRPPVGLAAEHGVERLEQPPLAAVVLADHGRDVGLELQRGGADPAVPLDPEGRQLHR